MIMRHNDGSAVRFLEETIAYSWTGPAIMRQDVVPGGRMSWLRSSVSPASFALR